MLHNHTDLKYETNYKVPSQQCWNNDTVTFQYSTIQGRYNINGIKTYTSDMRGGVICSPVLNHIYSVFVHSELSNVAHKQISLKTLPPEELQR